jgi:hypothetical protein
VRRSVKTRQKPRSSLLVHAYGHEVTGLKTYRGPKRKEQLGVCSLLGFYVSSVDVSDLQFEVNCRFGGVAGLVSTCSATNKQSYSDHAVPRG